MNDSKKHPSRKSLPETMRTAGPISVLGLATLLVVGACATVLEPMPEPARALGDTEVWQSRKGTATHTLVAMSDDTVSYEIAESGCTFTVPRGELLPWIEWSNCRRRPDGSQTVTLTKGRVWPLGVGQTWRYRKEGADRNGNRWNEALLCKVVDQWRVWGPAGDLETFRTVCKNESERAVFYVSPDLGRSVRVWHSRLDRSELPTKRDLVSFTPGRP